MIWFSGPDVMSPVVQDVGLEPTRYHYHWHLKPARLPFSSILHFKTKRIFISVAPPVELSLHGGESRTWTYNTQFPFFLKKLFAVSAYLRKEWNMYPLVELKRVELLTSWVQIRRSPNWAIIPCPPLYLSSRGVRNKRMNQKRLAGEEELESPTLRLTAECSDQLSYTPIFSTLFFFSWSKK